MKQYATIIGTGSYLPPNRVSNEELSHKVNTTDAWIRERTGIVARRIASDEETTATMAVKAAQQALINSNTTADEVDLIIVATATSHYVFPSTACLVQDALGCKAIAAFDIQAACSGFVYALTIAAKFIESGTHQKVLVIGSELMSRLIDWTDRNTCVLFGDGAGAVVVSRSHKPGILQGYLHADGRDHNAIGVQMIQSAPLSQRATLSPYMFMEGKRVFKFAVKAFGEVWQEALTALNLSAAEIDWIIPHQANKRILEAAMEQHGVPLQKVISTVAEHSNTSSASIPLALDECVRQGKIKPGDTVMLIGFGAGMTWGAVVLKW